MAAAVVRRQLGTGLFVLLSSAAQIASLRLGEQDGLQPAVASERRKAKSVAVCLVGEARVIGCKPVLDNIMATMYTPIADEADVFVAMKVDSLVYGSAKCVSGDAQTAIRDFLQANLRPAAIEFRGEGPIIPECEEMNTFECKPAFLLGVPCLEMVSKHEREQRGGQPYDYLMHLRGDLVYRYSLPPFAEWPAVHADLLYTGDCLGGRVDSTGRCLPEYTNDVGDHGLGCIRDTWGLMSRHTADIYYQRDWKFEHHDALARERTGLGCLRQHIFECLRGCTMHYNEIEVYRINVNSRLLHSNLPSANDQAILGELVLQDGEGHPRGKSRRQNTTQAVVPLAVDPENIFDL